MATRPIFISSNNFFYEEKMVEFEYHGGFALKQKQKCIESLHFSSKKSFNELQLLEISTSSTISIGKKLSAFNLIYHNFDGSEFTIESAFQSSKIFENGGPYIDLLKAPSVVAKKDNRIRESGRVIGFEFLGKTYPTEPKTAFYDWIYINALNQNNELHDELLRYNAFTDIEFNPKKSINCQARSVAIFVSLKKQGLLDFALSDFETFKTIVYKGVETENIFTQKSLFG